MLAEGYLQGFSTRKVRAVVEALCGERVSASTVSRATKQLDGTLASWRTRRVDAQTYPYLIGDAHYERIWREGQVLSTAVLWVMGVGANGFRDYLGVWIGHAESGPVWSRVFKNLHQRGQVHYLRNVLSKVSTPTRQKTVLAALRDVWSAPTRAVAEARGQGLVDSLRASLPDVADWLEETLGDTLGFYLLKESEARRRLRTTNALEREHEAIRRRTRVIRIFPNDASYLRLASALAADRNDGWAMRRYIIPASPTVTVKNVMRTTRAA